MPHRAARQRTASMKTPCRLAGIDVRRDVREAREAISAAVDCPGRDWRELVRQLEERDDLDVTDVIRAALLDRGMGTPSHEEWQEGE